MNPKDLRYTPKSAFEPLLEYLPNSNHEIYDPCCGDGRLVGWMTERKIPAIGTDIRTGFDYLKLDRYDYCVVTNPPYSIWQSIVNHALKRTSHVYMLLNLRYLGAQNRKEWWKRNEPKALFVLSERPRFDRFCLKRNRIIQEDHTDNAEYAWFYWGLNHEGIFHL